MSNTLILLFSFVSAPSSLRLVRLQPVTRWFLSTSRVSLQFPPHWAATVSAGVLAPRVQTFYAKVVSGSCSLATNSSMLTPDNPTDGDLVWQYRGKVGEVLSTVSVRVGMCASACVCLLCSGCSINKTRTCYGDYALLFVSFVCLPDLRFVSLVLCVSFQALDQTTAEVLAIRTQATIWEPHEPVGKSLDFRWTEVSFLSNSALVAATLVSIVLAVILSYSG